MSENNEIINRVAQSPLVTFNLEDYYTSGDRVELDIKDWLFQGLILKEKDFRNAVKEHPWEEYINKHVAINCSADAIIPTWAYMLITIQLEPYAASVIRGSIEELEKYLFMNSLNKVEIDQFVDKKVVVKGCSHLPVPEFAYVEISRKLRPVVSSLMYGEPCSTVPLYKKPRK